MRKEVIHMKCKIIVDSEREEEVLLCVHEANQQHEELKKEIDELLLGYSSEIIGYGDGEIILLSPADVHCFIIEGGILFALTANKKLQLRQRLYTLEESLGNDFIKINQSCIANVKMIERFETSIGASLSVIFKCGHRDYVSRRQLKSVKERIGFKL